MIVFEKGLVTILIVDAIVSLLAIPLSLKGAPRKRIYGYRTRMTLRHDMHWCRINTYFAVRLLVATLLSACVAVILIRVARSLTSSLSESGHCTAGCAGGGCVVFHGSACPLER